MACSPLSYVGGDVMAIIHFVNYRKAQNNAGMKFVLNYTMQDKKTVSNGKKFVSGINCTPASAYTEFRNKQREHDRLTKRKVELNALFKRLYEDNVLGRVTNEQFRMLSEGYTDEQKALNLRLPELEKEIRQLTESASNVDKFISLAKKYTRITELTPEILHTFISKIVIHERSERYKQHSEQQIDIYFTHIGIVGEA